MFSPLFLFLCCDSRLLTCVFDSRSRYLPVRDFLMNKPGDKSPLDCFAFARDTFPSPINPLLRRLFVFLLLISKLATLPELRAIFQSSYSSPATMFCSNFALPVSVSLTFSFQSLLTQQLQINCSDARRRWWWRGARWRRVDARDAHACRATRRANISARHDEARHGHYTTGEKSERHFASLSLLRRIGVRIGLILGYGESYYTIPHFLIITCTVKRNSTSRLIWLFLLI